ncbi:MAG: substrate-binding domain-containing protein [Bacillota bacterium]|nr:substrate-binding domain-containing protein [Bacillota bacterium]
MVGRFGKVVLVSVCIAALIMVGCGSKKPVILATTTSTVDSGLLDVLVPMFEQKTGYRVKTIAVGTGQALAMGEKGDADVLFVHSPVAEQKLVDSGVAIDRHYIMYNDYVILGPQNDPAGIRGMSSASEALSKIAQVDASFVSRGDDSGTHKKEKQLWRIQPQGTWYIEAGAGMSATLAIAEDKQAYILSDRGTYLAYKKNLSLEVLVEGDGPLLNPYHVMRVNEDKYKHVNAHGAIKFIEFLMSHEVREIIRDFGVDKYGEALFVPK